MQDYEIRHLETMRKCAPECMVLLKSTGDFPLDGPGRIALYGSGARHTLKGGTGSGDVNSRSYVTVEQGLEKEGFEITTKDWLDAYDRISEQAHAQFIKDIKKKARQQHTLAVVLGMGAVMQEPDYELAIEPDCETAVYVLSRICGEGNDRNAVKGDLLLTDTEVRDILACQERYEKFMLVLNVGAMIDLSPVESVGNILVLSQLGAVMGDAFTDVLLGKSYPSGKLSASWVKAEDVCTIGDFAEADDTRYKEGVYVGYRYYDSVGVKPLFPFGFGRGYTEFEVSDAQVSAGEEQVTVSAQVRNTGSRCGKEVLQLYVTAPWGKLDQPYQKLIAFAKTGELAPGESCRTELSFDPAELASYDPERSSYVVEAGDYVLRLGTSSRDTEVCAVLTAEKEQTVAQLSPAGGEADFEDWRPEPAWASEGFPEVPHIPISPKPQSIDPAAPSDLAMEFARTLSDEQLCDLSVGAHQTGPSVVTVIGNSSFTVAGAAGETYAGIDGIPNLIMADGPAGLRLSREYYADEKGAHSLGETIPAGISDFMPSFLQKMAGGKKNIPDSEVKTQYCTAIPIGTAIAQSWNPEIGEQCGDVVGSEMERFGVSLWLAPAFNIQRSPLCGRNFEYYSEDPLLSGIFGAAVTNGVQKKHPGCGVTIKHFCCNNQETNRYQSNSVVGERALREIYMKPFEICIRRSDPTAVMTSYNLLNGVHTSEREDLLRQVLRQEWGWDGVVMSDWVIDILHSKKNKYPGEQAVPSVAAGNALFMPGSSGNVKSLLKAVKGGTTLTRQQLEEGAAYIIQTVWRLRREDRTEED